MIDIHRSARRLVFLAPPLLLYFAAGLLFELSVDPERRFIDQILAITKDVAAPDLQHALAEVKARFVWFAAALLNIVAPIAAIAFSIAMIRTRAARVNLTWTVFIGVLLNVVTLGHLFYIVHTESILYRAVFGFTYDALSQSGLFSTEFLQSVYSVIFLINVLAALAPAFLLLAIYTTLDWREQPGEDELVELTVRMRRLKELISVGSAFLVVGVFHMSVWLKWTANLVSDPAVQAEVTGVALSISTYWGVAFSLVLIATYVPPAMFLHHRARALRMQGVDHSGLMEAEQWLNENGLSFKLNYQLPQLATILAPFVAAPLSATLNFM